MIDDSARMRPESVAVEDGARSVDEVAFSTTEGATVSPMTSQSGSQPQTKISPGRAGLVLAVTIVMTAILYLIPGLRFLAWPLRLLSTVAHELGHGFAAILVGGRFEALLMWSDGSGVATWTAHTGRLAFATIAAGGLIGPALAAGLCLVTGRTAKGARITLVVLGGALLIADLLLVRTVFGAAFVAILGLVLLASGLSRTPWLAQSVLLFVAVQLALSVFSRADYLFTPLATTGRGTMPSDVARIAEALILPYWFWGGCCGLLSVAILVVALRWTLSPNTPRDT